MSGETAQGAASRQRLLDAGLELFAERGYSATSVDALCRHAGIVKTALYWHFGSKEGLLTAVLDRVATEWMEEIQKSTAHVGAPLERLDMALRGMRTIVEERPRLLRFLMGVVLERATDDPALRETVKGIFGRAREAVVRGIAEALGGTLPGDDLIAHTLLSLMQGAALRRLVEQDAADLDRVFQEIRRTLMLLLGDRMRAAAAEAAPRRNAGGG